MPSLLRERPFLLLASARTISVLGNSFARVALAFAVLGLPGATPAELSLVLACQALPVVLFVLVGGVIADRMSRSRVMVLAELGGGVAYAALAAMVLSGHAPLWALCVLAAFAGSASTLFHPASEGVVPLIVDERRLQRANGLLRMGMNSATVLGLALSGITVAFLGAGWALAVNAASYLVSAALIAGLRLAEPPRGTTSPLQDLARGWREFAARQWLWAVVVQFTFVVAAINAMAGVLGPLLAEDELGGARAWSALVTAQAVGMVAGAGLAARLRVGRPVLVAVLATFVFAAPMLLLGLRAPLWATAAAMFCSGIAHDVFGVLWATTMQREIPQDVLSRVASYDLLGSVACAPLGLFVAGPIAAVTGPAPALAGCAALVVLAGAGALLSPQVRRLRAVPQPA
ncbi:Enterobactin exporter EntS [Streptomyces sp. RB5]|uniref:Enterobactin exporter EntS n=1 Tax=Streptomyces smaragdinus TaxID=2585196 RepID=A0A7K0CI07_9ACTN|nr:MFS transporter [Streptomyces smaragdinus]MQY12953.1 Enterobactin exporter EntS [Streptomyces smaragdinus]